jgi:hypothetical protein
MFGDARKAKRAALGGSGGLANGREAMTAQADLEY